jgi:hypothetical protein
MFYQGSLPQLKVDFRVRVPVDCSDREVGADRRLVIGGELAYAIRWRGCRAVREGREEEEDENSFIL